MKKIFYFVAVAMMLFPFSACSPTTTLSTTVTETQTATVTRTIITGVALTDINIEPANGSYLTPEILINNTSVITEILDRTASNGWSPNTYYAGDLCYVVRGTMENQTDTDWQVLFHGDGYDSTGKQVSQTLDVEPGPLKGLIVLIISGHSSHDFTIHMNWADSISRIAISGSIYDSKTPLP